MQLILVATAIVVAVAIFVLGGSGLEESPWTAVAGVLLVVAGSVLLARHWFERKATLAVVPGLVLLVAGAAGITIGGYGWFAVLLPVPIAVIIIGAGRVVPCPPDKQLVVFGKMAGSAPFRIFREATRVKQIIQDFRYLDLSPYDIDGRKVAIDPDNSGRAAVKLLDLSRAEVEAQARAILAENGDLATVGMKVVE